MHRSEDERDDDPIRPTVPKNQPHVLLTLCSAGSSPARASNHQFIHRDRCRSREMGRNGRRSSETILTSQTSAACGAGPGGPRLSKYHHPLPLAAQLQHQPQHGPSVGRVCYCRRSCSFSRVSVCLAQATVGRIARERCRGHGKAPGFVSRR